MKIFGKYAIENKPKYYMTLPNLVSKIEENIDLQKILDFLKISHDKEYFFNLIISFLKVLKIR